MLYALTPDGTRLPVLDLDLAEFATPDSPAEIALLAQAALDEEKRRGPLQRFFLRFVMQALANRSRLVAALQAARAGFLSGIPTYVLKLGADNLVPPYDTELDRRVVATPIVRSMRVRLAQVAGLLAEGLAPRLVGHARPLAILEIAGGPSADALNALLRLARQGLLAGRNVQVLVYDLDTEGPGFAANMLAALKTGPLAGMDISLSHVPGNWSDAPAFARLLASLSEDAVIAATSEGGLFEYGSDSDIIGILTALAARKAIVTGSVTRDDEINGLMRRHSSAHTRPRGLDRFGALIAPTGYRIERSGAAVLSDQVLLTRS